MLGGCTENILIICYFYYKLLLPYYFGLEVLLQFAEIQFKVLI
jgi:hypothetical protein